MGIIRERSLRVVKDVELVFENGRRVEHDYVFLQKFIKNYDERILKLSDVGEDVRLMKRLMMFVKMGYSFDVNHERGLDLMGGALVKDVLEGLPQMGVMALARLPIIRGAIREYLEDAVPGVLGQARNVIKNDRGVYVCADPGMFPRMNRAYIRIVFAGLVEVLKELNSRFPVDNRIEEGDLKALPVAANFVERRIAGVLLPEMMRLFDHHEAVNNAIVRP